MTSLDYLLVDLDRVRAAGLIERVVADPSRETFNRDDATTFIHLTLQELIDADAIIGVDVEIPASSTSAAIRSPAWYRDICDRQAYAAARGHLTVDEQWALLDFWHAVAMNLLPPDGWRRKLKGSWWQQASKESAA